MTARQGSGVWLVLVLACCTSTAACAGGRDHAASVELRKLLAGAPPPETPRAVWDDVRAFYALREHAPAWIGESAPSKRAKEALRLIGLAGEHGLLAPDYDEAAIARLLGELSASDADANTSDR